MRRGQLIAKYKQGTTAAESRDVLHPEQIGTTAPTLPAIATLLPDTPSTPSSPLQDRSFFYKYLHDYEVSVYPVNPIITPDEVQFAINEMYDNNEARAFVYMYIATTINLTGFDATENTTRTAGQVEAWCHEAVPARGVPLLVQNVTVRRIMTSEFLHICLLGLGHRDAAFLYLREAIDMIITLRVDHADVMESLSSYERARRQRLYYEAYVHERYFAIFDYRPICLPQLPYLPEFDSSLPTGVHHGFTQIIRLFNLIDGDFLDYWLGNHNIDAAITAAWVEDKHRQIDAERAGDDQEVAWLTDMQQADLIITKHWIRMLVWQLAMSKCLLSSVASKESMTLLFPVRLSTQLRNLVEKISRQSVEIHGTGIQQKLFEVTNTIGNVIITVPASTVDETIGRVDDFMFLVNFFFDFPRLNSTMGEILQKKLETLQSLFPYSANTPESVLSTGAFLSPAADQSSHGLNAMDVTSHRTDTDDFAGESGDQQSPPPPIGVIQRRAPARVWRDMTRRLSLAPSAMHSDRGSTLRSVQLE